MLTAYYLLKETSFLSGCLFPPAIFLASNFVYNDFLRNNFYLFVFICLFAFICSMIRNLSMKILIEYISLHEEFALIYHDSFYTEHHWTTSMTNLIEIESNRNPRWSHRSVRPERCAAKVDLRPDYHWHCSLSPWRLEPIVVVSRLALRLTPRIRHLARDPRSAAVKELKTGDLRYLRLINEPIIPWENYQIGELPARLVTHNA